MKKLLLLIVVLLAVAYFTNPTLEDYSDFIAEDFNEESDDSIFGEEVGNLVGNLIAENATDREDYYIFSIYESDLMVEDVRYIGIFGMFFELE